MKPADPSQPPEVSQPHAAAAHKARRGLVRLWHAGRHSVDGLAAGWREKAFRLEVLCACAMVPAAFWIGRNWLEAALLAGCVVAVMVVELLNTAIEAVVDRVGTQWHALAKKAKDLGSAAVLLTALWCGGVWVAALWSLWARRAG